MMSEPDPAVSPHQETARHATVGKGTVQRPLSTAQSYWWWMHQTHPEVPIHTSSVFFHVHGRLNRSALGSAVAALFTRHAALRTAFDTAEGAYVQSVLMAWSPKVAFTNVRRPLDVVLPELVAREKRRRVDPAVEPLASVGLTRFALDEHVLFISTHRLRIDDTSRAALHRDLVQLYGASLNPSELPRAHTDETSWAYPPVQERWDSDYWQLALADMPSALDLPADRSKFDRERGCGGERIALPTDLVAALRSLAEEVDCTVFDIVHAALQVVLSHHTDQTDFLIGTVYTPESRPPVGRFDMLLPLRADLRDSPPVTDLLHRVRERRSAARKNWGFPLGRMINDLAIRTPGRMPLLQVLISEEQGRGGPLEAGGIRFELLDTGGDRELFELACGVRDVDSNIVLTMTYQRSLFEAPTIRRLVSHWNSVLAGMVDDTSARATDFSLLTRRRSRMGPYRQAVTS